ncbi:MAG: ABC transporter permease [Rhodothermales bacterium]|nr:ABC transporter permease [Rhodothermales bacterium]MBO6780673.1 ABC transporter permease [Rhodothermales bacterium]
MLGLTLGLTCCGLILLFVTDELGWERGHEHADRIVQFVEEWPSADGPLRVGTTYGPLALALKEDFAQLEDAVRVLPQDMLLQADGREAVQEEGMLFVDSTFFSVFTFGFEQGSPQTALERPFSVVLTQSAARRYFGGEDALGQTLLGTDDEGTHAFEVTAVIQDPPRQTLLQFGVLASFSSMRTLYGTWIEDPRNWDHPPLYTFGLMRDSGDAGAVRAGLPAFSESRLGPVRASTRTIDLVPLGDLRLRAPMQQTLGPSSDITYVYLFSIIAVLILAVACANFTNLAAARTLVRAGEVGTRKALGAGRWQLLRQFWLESAIQSAAAVVLALVLLEALLPAFNRLSGKDIATGLALQPWMPLLALGTVMIVSTAAGAYPAWLLSRLAPSRAVRGLVGDSTHSASVLRRGLVVAQFVIAIALIVTTGVVQRQLDYVRSERLGFDKERVVIVPFRELENQYQSQSLLNSWRALSAVEYATASSGMPGLGDGIHDWVVRPVQAPLDSVNLMVLTVDQDYVETYGLQVVSGRDFSWEYPTDASAAFLLNESAAARIGWSPEQAVGQQIDLGVWFNGHIDKRGEVVGVVRDFQYNSLHRSLDPILFHILPESYYYDWASARLAPGPVPEALASLEDAWKAFNPGRPFEYRFLDEQFDALYRSEDRLATLLGLFSIVGMLIACLGLFGLAALAAERRTKEIGIRKVLGASVPGMVALLSRDLLVLVGIAFVVATPLTWAGVQWWIEGFAASPGMPWTRFLLALAITLGAAWAAVGYQAIRAATVDPVRALRYE